MKYGRQIAIALLACLIAMPLSAKDKDEKAKAGAPEAYAKVSACRTLKVDTERLACYDAAISALDTAVANNEVYMVDKKQVRETRKTLFGLPIPSFGLFGEGKGDGTSDDEVNELVSTITQVKRNADGWVVTITEGSTWQQIDSADLALSPKVGGQVTIKKAALGAYKMNVGKQPAIKVKRII